PYTLGTLPRDKFPEPVRFKLAQSALAIPGDRTVKLEHSLLGGKGPYRMELLTQWPECKLDAESGTLTVDGVALVKSLEASLVEDGPRGQGNRQVLTVTTEAEKHIRAQFARLVGRPPIGLPVLIPISLRGFDSESQR